MIFKDVNKLLLSKKIESKDAVKASFREPQKPCHHQTTSSFADPAHGWAAFVDVLAIFRSSPAKMVVARWLLAETRGLTNSTAKYVRQCSCVDRHPALLEHASSWLKQKNTQRCNHTNLHFNQLKKRCKIAKSGKGGARGEPPSMKRLDRIVLAKSFWLSLAPRFHKTCRLCPLVGSTVWCCQDQGLWCSCKFLLHPSRLRRDWRQNPQLKLKTHNSSLANSWWQWQQSTSLICLKTRHLLGSC